MTRMRRRSRGGSRLAAVLSYLVGGKSLKAKIDGKTVDVSITRKFFGDDAIIERAIVTLASSGHCYWSASPAPGKLGLGTSGGGDIRVLHSHHPGHRGHDRRTHQVLLNIARVIAEGPKPDNLIPSPTMIAMRTGGILRFEEITRCVPDVQDALVSILSDKAIAVPELPDDNMVWAKPGFNVIATANTRDQGVNELSAALKRRFNYIHIPIVADQKTEIEIVQQRSSELMQRYDLPTRIAPPIIELLATVFREIRQGKTSEGVSVKQPSTTLSTAEAIGTALDSALHARFFGTGQVTAGDVARNIVGSIVKEDLADLAALKEYVVLVAKKRATKDKAWKEFHDAMLGVLK